MPTDLPDVAALISVAESAHLTRAEIARRSGLSRASITRLANGERGTSPSVRTFVALQRVVDELTIVNK